MRDAQNTTPIRPGYVLAPQVTCPVVLGQTGLWVDKADGLLKYRNADGSDSAGGAGQGTVQTLGARVATTGALPTNTYDNGVFGVGATLTKTTNGALPAQDGVTLSVGDSLLVAFEGTPSHNGLYVVTSLGSGGTKWKLTRSAQFAESAQMIDGTVVAVKSGTAYPDTTWKYTGPDSPTVGTDALTFALQAVTQLKIGTFRSVGAGAPGAVFTGVAAAGPVTLTGAKVGDKVVSLTNLTDSTDGSGSFESTITVIDQIQQTSASNLSTKKFALLLLAQS